MKSHELIEYLKKIKQDTLTLGDHNYYMEAIIGNSCNTCIEQLDQIGTSIGFHTDIREISEYPENTALQTPDSAFCRSLEAAHATYTDSSVPMILKEKKEQTIQEIEIYLPHFREDSWFKIHYNIITLAELNMIKERVLDSQTDLDDLARQLAAEDIRDTIIESTLSAVNGDLGDPTAAIRENLSVRLKDLYECPIHPAIDQFIIQQLSQFADTFQIKDCASNLQVLDQLASNHSLDDMERASLEMTRQELYVKIYSEQLEKGQHLADAYEQCEDISVDACLAYHMGCHTSRKPIFLSDPCTASYLMNIDAFTMKDIVDSSKRLFPFGPQDNQMIYAMTVNQEQDPHYRVYAEHATYLQEANQIKYGLRRGKFISLNEFYAKQMKKAGINDRIVKKMVNKIEQATKSIQIGDPGR